MIFNPTISFEQKLKMGGYLRKGYNNDVDLRAGDWVLNTGNNFFTGNIASSTTKICWYDDITFVSYDYSNTPYLRLYKVNITNTNLGSFTISQLKAINLTAYIPNYNYNILLIKKLDNNRMVAIIGTPTITNSNTSFLFFNCDGNNISSLSQTNTVNAGQFVTFNDLIESSNNTYICVGGYLENDRSILRAFSVSGNNLSLIGQYNDSVNNNNYFNIYKYSDSAYVVQRRNLSSSRSLIQLFNFVGNNFSPVAQYTPNYDMDIEDFGNNFVQINNNTYLICGNENASSITTVVYELLQVSNSNINLTHSGTIQNIRGNFWDISVNDNNIIALICNVISVNNYDDYFWTVVQFSIENNLVNVNNIIHNCFPLDTYRITYDYRGTNLNYLSENGLVLWYDDGTGRRGIDGLSVVSTVAPITSNTEYEQLNDYYNVIGIVDSIDENGIANIYYPV